MENNNFSSVPNEMQPQPGAYPVPGPEMQPQPAPYQMPAQPYQQPMAPQYPPQMAPSAYPQVPMPMAYPNPYMPGYSQPAKKKGLAVTSLILGIIGFFTGILFGFVGVIGSKQMYANQPATLQAAMLGAFIFMVPAFLAVLFGLIALIAKNSKGMSIAGLVLGVIPTILWLIAVAL